jgi:hypothetical protein
MSAASSARPVAKRSFELDGALEGVAAAIPAMVVRPGYLDGDSGIFRLHACSRIVIAVHAASEALSSSYGFAAAVPPLLSGPPIENTDAPA